MFSYCFPRMQIQQRNTLTYSDLLLIYHHLGKEEVTSSILVNSSTSETAEYTGRVTQQRGRSSLFERPLCSITDLQHQLFPYSLGNIDAAIVQGTSIGADRLSYTCFISRHSPHNYIFIHLIRQTVSDSFHQ